MQIQLNLGAANFEFNPEDVVLGENQIALLADVEKTVTIAPKSFARIATPVRFTGNGKTIALIDMHAGKMAHALEKFDGPIVARGEYFLPDVGEEVQISVDVINETNATLMIPAKTMLGIISFINLGSDDVDGRQDPSIEAEVTASYNPQFLDKTELPAYAHIAAHGVNLRADLGEDFNIHPGESVVVPTGLKIDAPEGMIPQIRATGVLPRTVLIEHLPAAAVGERQFIDLTVTNMGASTATVRPGDAIAELTFTPIVRANLAFADRDSSPANAQPLNY